MTAISPSDAALVAAHKRLAQHLQDGLRHHVPQVDLTHVQTLHVIAALHGVPTWQTLLARPHRERLPDTPALAALAHALEQRGIHLPEPVLVQLLDSVNPLTFTVLNQDIRDTPAKTTVALSLRLDGPITPEPLRRLLLAEFERISTLSGFYYHPHPTSIFIWAYPSEAHHQGGAGQWAGMLQRSNADFQAGKAPQVTIKVELIRAIQEPPIERFGLPEVVRRVLYLDHCRVTNRARLAADDAHPVGDENTRESMRLNQAYKNAQLAQWEVQLAKQHRLSEAQYREVVVEGMVRHWPMSSLSDTATETIP